MPTLARPRSQNTRSPVGPSHISLPEFYNAFVRVWKPIAGPGGGTRPHLGIAVSGGVDSMALAALCAKLQERHQSIYRPRFHAFVVDHRARPYSNGEAKTVASRLRNMGLWTTILSLQWPSGVHPAGMNGFETQARRLRYRALGAACHRNHIRELLLAHHEDDQAELMLMKVADMGKHLWSLQPMCASEVNVPECWGMHGIHESGLRDFQATVPVPKQDRDGWELRDTTTSTELPSETFGINCEEGGIKLYRPLMYFSKGRLEATCRKHGVDWVEDETNKDVTFTPRNTVRSLLQQHVLPEALDKASMLTLATKIAETTREYRTRVDNLIRDTKFLSLDLRSGRLSVRLPQRRLSSRGYPETLLNEKLSIARTKATLFLTRLLSIVTPLENIKLSNVQAVIDLVYPDILGPGIDTQINITSSLKFTVGGALLQRLKAPAAEVGLDHVAALMPTFDNEYIWVLTREPFRRSELPCLIISPGRQDSGAGPNRQALTFKQALTRSSYPAWELWDGRYWLRVFNYTDADLVVRPFRQGDLQMLKHQMLPAQFEDLKKQLRVAAPGETRWTLPVIAETTSLERPLVLPTLRYDLALVPSGLQWDIRYKYIDLRGMKDTSCIIR